MNIIIIANFPAALDGTQLGRFTYLGEMLCNKGHNVEIIISSFHHGKKQQREPISARFSSKITMIYEPGYPNNVCLKRFYSHYIWGKGVEKYLKSLSNKPNVIYCAIPSLTAAVRAAKICHKNGIRFITDIQDLWPEAFQMVIKNKILQLCLKPIEWYVNMAYRAADITVAVSDTYVNRGLRVNKHSKKSLCVYLGNDGEKFDRGRETYKIDRPTDELWIAYIGTLGYSYDIPCAIDGIIKAQEIIGDNIKLKFVVMGNGPLRNKFEDYAKEKGLYCEFTGSLPYEKMVGLMCSCDMVINPIIKGAAQSITNKVGDYALSGLPVISTQECQEYRNLIEQYHCGFNCEVGNSDDVAKAIVSLVNDNELYVSMKEGSEKLGQERFDRRKTYSKIIDIIETCK